MLSRKTGLQAADIRTETVGDDLRINLLVHQEMIGTRGEDQFSALFQLVMGVLYLHVAPPQAIAIPWVYPLQGNRFVDFRLSQ